jgi:hypothetical protein
MDSAAVRLRGHKLQPTGTNQSIEQAACLFGIKPTAECLTPDLQQRYLSLLVCPNPTQYAVGVGVLFSQPDLPEGRSTVWQEIISPQPHSSLNVLLANGLRLGTALHSPVQVSQRATQAQHMGAALATHSRSRPSKSGFNCARKARKVSKVERPSGDKSTVRGAKTPSSPVGKLTMRVRAF